MKIISVKRNALPRAVGTVLAAALLLLGTACGANESVGGSPGQPGQLSIVAAAYPFQFVAERVAGERGAVTSLTAPGAEPHDVELTPRQVASIAEADLVVYLKGFQPAVDEAVAQSGNPRVLDTTTVVPLRPLAEDEHGEESHGDERDHGQGQGGLDPHVWLDPTKLISIVDAVAGRLAEQDPENAEAYRANAAALTQELTTLDQEYRTGLSPCVRREFVTTHAAFGYLADRYDLVQISIAGLSPDSEPSPARIAEVQREAKEHQITTIFYETLVSPDVARSIADDLGLKTDVLDPIEGITPESRGQDYLAVMRSNLPALRSAGECPM